MLLLFVVVVVVVVVVFNTLIVLHFAINFYLIRGRVF
jgi:hypothetical protein